MPIVDRKNIAEINTGHGEHIFPLTDKVSGDMQHHSVAYVEIEPNKSSLNHYHPEIEETYYILSGKGEIKLNNEVLTVADGQLISILPNTEHKIKNLSNSEFLILIATCAPGWTEECSVFLE